MRDVRPGGSSASSGTGPLHEYRLFYLYGDGHIYLSFDFAPDDAAAVALAQAHEVRTGMELWSGARRVREFVCTRPFFE